MLRSVASVVVAAVMASGCVRATRPINTAPLTPAELAAHAYGYSVTDELINVKGEFRRIEIPGGRYQYVTQPLVTVVHSRLEEPAGPLLTRASVVATVFDNNNPPDNRRVLATQDLPLGVRLSRVGETRLPVMRFVVARDIVVRADEITLVWELDGRSVRFPLDLKKHWR
jgi:hypothetical protein